MQSHSRRSDLPALIYYRLIAARNSRASLVEANAVTKSVASFIEAATVIHEVRSMVTFIFNGDEYKVKNHRTTAELIDELAEMKFAFIDTGGRLWQIAADAIKTMLQLHCL